MPVKRVQISCTACRAQGLGRRRGSTRPAQPAHRSRQVSHRLSFQPAEGAAHYTGNGQVTKGLMDWRIPADSFDEFNSYIDHDLTEWWPAGDGHFFPPPGTRHTV